MANQSPHLAECGLALFLLGDRFTAADSEGGGGCQTTRDLRTVVASGLPVLAGARRVVEDRLWTALNPDELPWFALSSAASLRAALETGEPLAIKSGADGRLFRRPDEEPEPPLDDRGRL